MIPAAPTIIGLLACLVAAGTPVAAPVPGAMPLDVTLNDGWAFYRYDTGTRIDIARVPASGWEPVSIPHTARLEPRVVDDQWQGDALYRRRLIADRGWAGKAIWLRFEGAMMTADVYINGRHVAHHKGGYLPFTIDLSRVLEIGRENEILVHLDNRDNPITGPKPLRVLDFNTYGGLYRDVRLLVRDSLHITDEMLADEVAGGGIFVRYPVVTNRLARVAVRTHVENTGPEPRSFVVTQSLYYENRVIVTSTSERMILGPDSAMYDESELVIRDPRLWSPRHPELYRLETRIVGEGGTVDSRQTTVGIRRIAIENGRFVINGEATFLRGVNRHQEYPYVGYALSPEASYRDAKLIKEAGFDYVRLSHYPHSPYFMRAADELGLVVLDAILGWQFVNPDPAFADHAEQTCRDLIRRDRNHPSVIAWECSLNESAMPDSLVSRLHRAVHDEYPGDQAFSAGWMKGYDIYLQARQHRLQHYEEPDRPYVVSEYGDWEYYALNAGLDQDNWASLQEEERSSRQLISAGEKRLLQQALNIQEAHNDNFRTPAFADGYWVMFDYNRGYAADHEASGLMSIDRVPKFSYFFFRSQRDAAEQTERFDSGPMVYIASYWTPESTTAVRVFSNADEVELRLNGAFLERRRPDTGRYSDALAHPPFTFVIPHFEAGTLEAVALIGDDEVARTRRKTPGAVAGIKLGLATEGVPVAGNDTIFVRAALIDADGTVVPDNGERVEFRLDCPATRIVGPSIQATEAGIASALLQTGATEEDCLVVATHGQLEQSYAVRVP